MVSEQEGALVHPHPTLQEIRPKRKRKPTATRNPGDDIESLPEMKPKKIILMKRPRDHPCVHGVSRRGYYCRWCPGKGICPHDRRRNRCPDCQTGKSSLVGQYSRKPRNKPKPKRTLSLLSESKCEVNVPIQGQALQHFKQEHLVKPELINVVPKLQSPKPKMERIETTKHEINAGPIPTYCCTTRKLRRSSTVSSV